MIRVVLTCGEYSDYAIDEIYELADRETFVRLVGEWRALKRKKGRLGKYLEENGATRVVWVEVQQGRGGPSHVQVNGDEDYGDWMTWKEYAAMQEEPTP